jgi:hypothetical protein
LDLIKKDMKQKDKKGIRKYIYFKDFFKDYRHHMMWAGKYFKPNETTEGRKQYDKFFSYLTRTKIDDRTYKSVLKNALSCSSYCVYKEDYSKEYLYVVNKKSGWIKSIRIDCELIKPGWDDGEKKPKNINLKQITI